MRQTLAPAHVAAGAAIILLTLAGCAGPGGEAEPADPPPVSAPAPDEGQSSEGGDVDADSTDGGTTAGDSVTAVDLPANWPDDVPVIPGVIVDATYVPGDSVTFWGLRVLPEVAIEDADDEALAIMEAAGFTVAGGRENADGTVNRQFENADHIVVINISLEPGEDGVLYNVRPR